MYAVFENARYFEGEIRNEHAVRAFIWENTDKDRSGIVPGALDDDFGYEKYADYILNNPPILEIKDGIAKSTGDKKVKDILDPDNYKIEELEHFLTMFFPDVRTKRFMEIRMMDAVPYPLNFAVIAMWKGIIYNQESLNKAYELIEDINEEEVVKVKHEMMDLGLRAKYKGKSLLDMGKIVVQLAKEGLDSEEVHYILPLETMLNEGKNPYSITKEGEAEGKKAALNWCLLNNVIKG
jgi:glutamate--cysteine ligase